MNSNTTIPSAHPATASIEDILKEAIASERKVFCLAFELRYPLRMPLPEDNGTIERFLKTLDKKFGPKLLDLDPRHVRLQVKEEEKKLCFRCVLALNGGRLGSPYGARVIIQEAWNMALGLRREPNYGLVGHGRFGDEGGVMLWRDAPFLDADLKDCRVWMSPKPR